MTEPQILLTINLKLPLCSWASPSPYVRLEGLSNASAFYSIFPKTLYYIYLWPSNNVPTVGTHFSLPKYGIIDFILCHICRKIYRFLWRRIFRPSNKCLSFFCRCLRLYKCLFLCDLIGQPQSIIHIKDHVMPLGCFLFIKCCRGITFYLSD